MANILRIIMALAVAATLLTHMTVPSAYACTCRAGEYDETWAKQTLASTDVVVVGVVETREGSDIYPEAVIRAEGVYKGRIESEFKARSGNCNGIVADFREGERWVLNLNSRDGEWQAHGCSSWPARNETGASYIRALDRLGEDEGTIVRVDNAAPMWPVIFGMMAAAAAGGAIFAVRRRVRRS